MHIKHDQLNASLADPRVEVMNFLNEVALRYPQAISFAPGRPLESFFDVRDSLRYLDDFVAHETLTQGIDTDRCYARLGQYGRTNGVIGPAIARLLHNDEAMIVQPEDIVVTVGSQEAMCLCLAVLCGRPQDVALVVDPAYIGFSGAARVLGIPLAPVPSNETGIDLGALERIADDLKAQGKQPRLLYLSPDHANPTGTTMPASVRGHLLDLTRRLDILVLEDHAYSYFSYDDERIAPLKAQPGAEHVLYMGSFSKSIYPGLRLGFLVADQRVGGEAGRSTRLADEISKVKSLLTVNTSPLNQAIAAGLLVRNDFSLESFVAPRRAALKRNRDALLAALGRHFPSTERWCRDIRWNRPSGGFFATLTVPFEVTDDDLVISASRYGVTWTPMSYFCTDAAPRAEIRLSFSYVDVPQIDEGVARLATMLQARGAQAAVPPEA